MIRPSSGPSSRLFFRFFFSLTLLYAAVGRPLSRSAAAPPTDSQPLTANVSRLLDALDYLGTPLPMDTTASLRSLIMAADLVGIQKLLNDHVLFHISINPELRVRVARGKADALLQQAGYSPVIIRIQNDATLTRRLRISSPQAGPIYAGSAEGILKRQAQTELKVNENVRRENRFLDLEIFEQSPMTSRLSGFPVEYMLALIYTGDSGQREATISFDVGEGTQDLGFRSEVPVLFTSRPAQPVRLDIKEADGRSSTARLEIRDADGRVYPPQARRLAPDFFFQPQIYRADGDIVLLPPGSFTMESSRGPEYLRRTQQITVNLEESEAPSDESSGAPDDRRSELTGSTGVIEVRLERWIAPADFGFWSGDHHIHGAGCSHYDNPTEGVTPEDMFAQVKGEGLNVGCVLTWGPCFDHQRNFFSPVADQISEPFTVLKYDLEISGFGSAAMGHVCLLNLKDQTFPGSEGTKTKGWPTWTVPVMRWAREQGGYTGYPHSALHVDAEQAAEWLLRRHDQDLNGALDRHEAAGRLLPADFSSIDDDGDQILAVGELQAAADRASHQLPNTAIPSMDGGGAMEIVVSTSEGVCDFISAMDTARIPEWNTWYHLLNCGFPLKLSGETDFPCMSSRRVGQGRVYVQLGDIRNLDFAEWCRGLAAGRSYVSDGYAHAVRFTVNQTAPGQEDVRLNEPGTVIVETSVAFAPEHPRAVAYGTLQPAAGKRIAGDTVNLHAPRDSGYEQGGERQIEVIVNGQVAGSKTIPADGAVHDIRLEIPVRHSSWIAVRQFPQLHTNPVNVLIENKPVRSSRSSAVWCAESVRLLWHNRRRFIAEAERPAARDAYQRAIDRYRNLALEAEGDPELRFPELSLESP